MLDDETSVEFAPREIKTALIYSFGRHVISTHRERWLDVGYLDGLDAAYDDVFLATRSAIAPPGFERVNAFHLRAIGFERSIWPAWRMRSTLDENVVVYRLSRSSYGVGSWQAFSAADDARLKTLVGTRSPTRGLMADGRPGVLLYGPYIALPPGGYRVRVWASAPSGSNAEAHMDVVYGQGANVLVAKTGRALAGEKPGPMGTLDFDVVASDVQDLEVRVVVDKGSRLVVSHLTLIRLR